MTSTSKDDKLIEGLVLRTTPYSETSLILVLLTRESGQQHFLLRGGRKAGKKKFPAADLFRLVEVNYREGKGELHPAKEIELVRPFDSIARSANAYAAALWLSRFALANSVVDHEAMKLFDAISLAFDRLSQPDTDARAIVLSVCFVALEEHGVSPDLSARPDKQRQLEEMVTYGLDSAAQPPPHSEETWQALKAWMNRYLQKVGLQVPPGWTKLP